MTNNSEKLDFSKPLILLLGFIVLISVLFFIFSNLDKQRKIEIYSEYKEETSVYIEKNREGLVSLFNDFYPKSICIANQMQIQPTSSPNPECKSLKQEEIAKLLPSDLKDWSSTMFLKYEGGRVMFMRLSGDTGELYTYPEDKKLEIVKLLNGEVDRIDWDDYVYELADKEVVFPVKDKNGKIVGAIMRGVIQQKGFSF